MYLHSNACCSTSSSILNALKSLLKLFRPSGAAEPGGAAIALAVSAFVLAHKIQNHTFDARVDHAHPVMHSLCNFEAAWSYVRSFPASPDCFVGCSLHLDYCSNWRQTYSCSFIRMKQIWMDFPIEFFQFWFRIVTDCVLQEYLVCWVLNTRDVDEELRPTANEPTRHESYKMCSINQSMLFSNYTRVFRMNDFNAAKCDWASEAITGEVKYFEFLGGSSARASAQGVWTRMQIMVLGSECCTARVLFARFSDALISSIVPLPR